jgi:hypothetical protein
VRGIRGVRDGHPSRAAHGPCEKLWLDRIRWRLGSPTRLWEQTAPAGSSAVAAAGPRRIRQLERHVRHQRHPARSITVVTQMTHLLGAAAPRSASPALVEGYCRAGDKGSDRLRGAQRKRCPPPRSAGFPFIQAISGAPRGTPKGLQGAPFSPPAVPPSAPADRAGGRLRRAPA